MGGRKNLVAYLAAGGEGLVSVAAEWGILGGGDKRCWGGSLFIG